jgi:large subunit ribosomal protein L9
MSELAKGLGKLVCIIKVKAGDDGKMFGAVTAGMIADELKHQFDVSLDKKKIRLEHPIKVLGEHEIELHLHQDVKSTLKVRVENITPPPAPPVEAAPAEAKPGVRTEKRGHRQERAEAAGGAEKPRAAKGEKAARPAKAKAE